MSEQKNEVKKSTPQTQVRKLIQSDAVKAQIEKALPSLCKPDRFLRIAMTAITKNPKLAECTQTSLMSCLLDCASLGIEPDGRRAHLIPYGNACTLILDYKGLIELVRRSGDVVKIHADIVCENDIFEYNFGEIEKHEINFRGDRGTVYAVYAMAEMKDGAKQCEVMTVADVEKIRQGSRGKNSSPWTQHWNEMAKKTVFRRLAKWLPLSSETLELISKDDTQFEKPKVDVQLPDEEDEEIIEG